MRGIITYHSVDPSGSVISLDQHTFERHVRWLASSHVRTTTIEGLERVPPEEDALAITFDDGFENFATVAWPLLREHGLSATLFVVTDYVGKTNAWGDAPHGRTPELPLLDWPSLGRLAEEGVALGTHSHTHRDLRTLEAEELQGELMEPARRIRAETGHTPTCLAYPYGAVDERVAAAAREAFTHACTMELRVLRKVEDPLKLPRLDAYYFHRLGRLSAWGSSRFRRYLWLRARARALRQLVVGAAQR